MLAEPEAAIGTEAGFIADVTGNCAEHSIPLILDDGLFLTDEDRGIYNSRLSLPQRAEKAREFGKRGEEMLDALNRGDVDLTYFTPSVHSILSNTTVTLTRFIRECEGHKSVVKTYHGLEVRTGDPETDEGYREIVHDARIALRPWIEMRKRISNRTIPDGLKSETKEAYERARIQLGPIISDVLAGKWLTKEHVSDKLERMVLGAIALGEPSHHHLAHIVTYNRIVSDVFAEVYKRTEERIELPRITITICGNNGSINRKPFPDEGWRTRPHRYN